MDGRAGRGVDASPESFELITIGEAFHRLDQRLIAERAMEWLAPGLRPGHAGMLQPHARTRTVARHSACGRSTVEERRHHRDRERALVIPASRL